MQPQISICRKRDNLYLKLDGDFNETSSKQMLQAVAKLVNTALKISPPDGKVVFSFRTCGKVDRPNVMG